MKKSTQIKKKPNKQDNTRSEKSTQIFKKPNKDISYSPSNPYDHQPNRNISVGWMRGGINE